MKYLNVLIVFILILFFIPLVNGFTVLDNFNSTILNTTTWTNKSTYGNLSFNVSNGEAVFFGNSSGSNQYNGGIYISSKNLINHSQDGLLTFKFQAKTFTGTSQAFFMSLGYPLGSIGVGVTGVGGSLAGTSGLYCVNYVTGLRACSGDVKTIDTGVHTITILVNRDGLNTIFTWFYDGGFWCQITQAGTVNLPANFTYASVNNVYSEIALDDFYFTDSSNNSFAGILPVGSYCGFDASVCLSKYCEYGSCSLKPGGRSCTDGSECLSSSCVNQKCNMPGAWVSMDNFVKLTFGSDTTSLTFISVAIILILMGGIIFVAKGSIAGIIAGTGVMIITMIFFTIVGWLPAFFIIGLVLLIIISIALMLVLR